MTSHAFCSRIAEAHEGVFPGTGVRGEVYVLLPVSKHVWGRSEMNSQWASLEELDAIRRARRAGVTTRLYNPKSDAAVAHVLVYRAPEATTESLEASSRLLGVMQAKGWRVDETGVPRLAICTHGTRDRCCAKWGFAVFREALRLHREGLSPFSPLECSHLGGDRYAATGIFFPTGSMYGHLDRADLQALGEAEASDRIVPGRYRGRVFEDPLTQVVRAGLARDGHAVGATTPLQVLNPHAAPGEVMAAAGGETFLVSLETVESEIYGSCSAVAQGRTSRVRRSVYAGARRMEA